MRKFIASVLSTTILLSCASMCVLADAESSVYTIDTTTKKISNVAPFTTVADFISNISNAEVSVVNVDGSEMDVNAYATENVFAVIDGELYTIDVKYGYAPIKTTGSTLANGTSLYSVAADAISYNSLPDTGFTRLEAWAKIGYGSDLSSPANTSTQTVKGTKSKRGGKDVYVIENDSNKYAYLRSHYSASTNYSTTLNSIRDTWATGPIITTVEFEADKLGNISIFNNTPVRNDSKAITRGDSSAENLVYTAELPYVPNSVHFLEDGSVKLGGVYSNYTVAQRSPIQPTSFTWQPGQKYTVAIVQRYLRGTRNGYVDAVYVNGTKIFPNADTKSHGDGRVALQSDGTFKIGTRASSVTHGGDLSSIMVGTAPKTADDNLKVYFSDVKVYGLATSATFDPAITDQNIALSNAENVVVTENDANNEASISDSVVETVGSFRAKYSDNNIIGVYNADGTMANDADTLETGMTAKIASADGLKGKTYKINATKPVSPDPDSEVYTVDTVNKVVSGVKPMTTVAAFLANFDNGSSMNVVNVDGSVMTSGYATENVYLEDPTGDVYTIAVAYPYAPIQTKGANLADDTELYDVEGDQINGNSLASNVFGFTRLEKYGKFGYGADVAAPENTSSQVARASKQTINGETVYVIENDTANYAFMRSHYTNSTNYSTELNNAIDSWTTKQIVTKVEFEADKLGNISVYNNTPVRNSDKAIASGDSGIDGLIYSAEAKYAPNSVHFLEDGSVKLGGIYANYNAAIRAPLQTTGFTWEPGEKYTVSIVQRYLRGTRNGYVDGVYINGTKVFPNANTESHSDGRVALQNDGTFKIGTRDNNHTYGGGLSSVMIGTAPEEADENLTVYLSDVKVYETAAYDPAADATITLTSVDPAVVVDNDNATITSSGVISASDFDTTAKIVVGDGYVKAVSADGLVAKTYTVIGGIDKGFYDGENGPEIDELADASGNSICFKATLADNSGVEGSAPAVMLAVYNKTGEFREVVMATGTKNADETTTYKAVMDISGYNKSQIELRGFIWAGLTGTSALEPLAGVSVLE